DADRADIALDADPFVLVAVLGAHRSLLSAVVGVFDEGHGDDPGWHRLAAHDQVDLRAVGRMGLVDVAHGDGAAERRREATGRDLAQNLAGYDDLGALARDRLALRKQADTFARRTLGNLLLHDSGTRKAALCPALLADAPQQASLD